jgi:hypothetical protein
MLASARGHDVVANHFIASTKKTRRDRRTHDAEADEADSRQFLGSELGALGARPWALGSGLSALGFGR